MVRTTYVKLDIFMAGNLSKIDDVSKYKHKVFKNFFKKMFPNNFWKKSVIFDVNGKMAKTSKYKFESPCLLGSHAHLGLTNYFTIYTSIYTIILDYYLVGFCSYAFFLHILVLFGTQYALDVPFSRNTNFL